MNETERKIIQYLRDRGLDITQYVDTFRHVIPGTICIVSISMWGIQTSGKYEHWCLLMDILKDPDCPIRMKPVESGPNERKYAFDRLIWKEE